MSHLKPESISAFVNVLNAFYIILMLHLLCLQLQICLTLLVSNIYISICELAKCAECLQYVFSIALIKEPATTVRGPATGNVHFYAGLSGKEELSDWI